MSEEVKGDLGGAVTIGKRVKVGQLAKVIGSRGPDSLVMKAYSQETKEWQIVYSVDETQSLADIANNEIVYSSVLHLRGHNTQAQPLLDSETGNVLRYNGEIF